MRLAVKRKIRGVLDLDGDTISHPQKCSASSSSSALVVPVRRTDDDGEVGSRLLCAALRC